MNDPHYKRGTIRKDGKLYGHYPDGSLYRIYSTTDRPFLQLVDVDGETFLRIRQATEHVCACRFATIDDALADMRKREDVESFSVIDNPLVYEQRVNLHGASLFEVLKKNKEFRGRL